MNAFQVELLKIPRKVREMKIEHFSTEFGGRIEEALKKAAQWEVEKARIGVHFLDGRRETAIIHRPSRPRASTRSPRRRRRAAWPRRRAATPARSAPRRRHASVRKRAAEVDNEKAHARRGIGRCKNQGRLDRLSFCVLM